MQLNNTYLYIHIYIYIYFFSFFDHLSSQIPRDLQDTNGYGRKDTNFEQRPDER